MLVSGRAAPLINADPLRFGRLIAEMVGQIEVPVDGMVGKCSRKAAFR